MAKQSNKRIQKSNLINIFQDPFIQIFLFQLSIWRVFEGSFKLLIYLFIGFPGSSVGKESTCNAGDPGSIHGSGSSPREGIGCPLQYSWASLVAQMVKNLPAMQETWFQSLGWKDPLENGRDTHSSILTRRIPWATVHRVAKS